MFFNSKRIKLTLGMIALSILVVFTLFMFQGTKNYCESDGKKYSVGYYDQSKACTCSEFGNVHWSYKGG